MHLCARPLNMSRSACCQLIQMLNDTIRVPLCDPSWTVLDGTDEERNTTVMPTYVYLSEPEEVREDHVTFLLGILILMLIAVGCTFTLSKLTKPKLPVSYGSVSNYNIMMWMPSSRSSRRSSFMVLLRGMTCRSQNQSNRESNALSVVSNMSLSLPSYQTATSSSPMSAVSSLSVVPPPPYYELQRLTAPPPPPDEPSPTNRLLDEAAHY